MSDFNPAMQIQYCRDIDRVFFGKAPHIGTIIAAYGRNTAESWLEIQLNDLSEFAGCREKMSIRQIHETAAMIVEAYPHYNLTEFMLFFQRFKRCQYGRFYGAVDPMIILQSLEEFNEERLKTHLEREKAELNARLDEADKAFEAMKQRYCERVPDADSPNAPISFFQYRLMRYDSMPDEEFNREIEDIRAGRKTLPKDTEKMLKTILQSFNSTDNE